MLVCKVVFFIRNSHAHARVDIHVKQSTGKPLTLQSQIKLRSTNIF